MNRYTLKNKGEKVYILLFFFSVIITQFMRESLSVISTIFNYHIFSIITIIYIILKSKKVNLVNFLCICIITLLNIIGVVLGIYGKTVFIRCFLIFIMPLMILVIDYNMDFKYVFRKVYKIFNTLIYVSFTYSILFLILSSFSLEKRISGIIGHSLTAAWYYAFFLSLNMLYCKYINKKKDYLIIGDILIALIGTVLTTGRIGIFICIFLSIIYIFNCCKSRIIKYVIVPLGIIGFMFTPIFYELIWSKFEFAAGYGDITNGRLLGIREMMFFDIYPNFFVGNGFGYSNYISIYKFGTLNFENPILMFSFDYGILSVIIMVFFSIILPTIRFIKNREFLIFINFILIVIIPYTYNGIAEATGLYFVLNCMISFYILLEKKIIRGDGA